MYSKILILLGCLFFILVGGVKGGTFEVTGGTGRFSKVIGEGTLTGYQKPDETSGFCYEGWIDY